MELWTKLLGVIFVAIVYTWNPWYVRSSLFDLAHSVLNYADLGQKHNPNSLKAAVANVTADFDQLTFILQDFFERLPDNSTETLFREFLQSKAGRTHKDFERFLDWVLGFYKFAWPFLVVYALLRLSSSSNKDKHDPDVHQRSPGAERHGKARKKTEDFPSIERRRSSFAAKGSETDLLAVSLREDASNLAPSFQRAGSSSHGPFGHSGRSLSAQSFG